MGGAFFEKLLRNKFQSYYLGCQKITDCRDFELNRLGASGVLCPALEVACHVLAKANNANRGSGIIAELEVKSGVGQRPLSAIYGPPNSWLRKAPRHSASERQISAERDDQMFLG